MYSWLSKKRIDTFVFFGKENTLPLRLTDILLKKIPGDKLRKYFILKIYQKI